MVRGITSVETTGDEALRRRFSLLTEGLPSSDAKRLEAQMHAMPRALRKPRVLA